MNTEDALTFLKLHQPLPPDAELDELVITKYDDARTYFAEFPNPECISLFLNSFGEGDGLGVYQLVEDTLLRHDEHDVVQELCKSLRSESTSVRYWSAQIAACYASPLLAEPLIQLLNDNDFDTKSAAITALGQNNSPKAIAALNDLLEREVDEELLDWTREVLDRKTFNAE